MPVLVRALAIATPFAILPVLAFAQSSSAPGPTPAETPAPAPSAAPASADAAPAASAKPVVPATGYSYGAPSTQPPPRPERTRAARTAAPQSAPGSDAMRPGFETLPDGSTRLFVDLSKAVAYDAKTTPSTLTVVLKDAHVDRRNNQNPLVTLHFNTPVTAARLVPHGRDVWFVVDLRSNVAPTVSMASSENGKDAGSQLRIVFPKGEYLASRHADDGSAQRPQASASATP